MIGLPEIHDTVNAIIEWSDQILSWHRTAHPMIPRTADIPSGRWR